LDFTSSWQKLPQEVNVPCLFSDDLAVRLIAAGGDLSRRALGSFGGPKGTSMTASPNPELQRLFGIETGFQFDELLKAHDVDRVHSGRRGA
jgi:hypothetical protein